MSSLKPSARAGSIAAEHSPGRERPLASYGVLMATFSGLAAAFATWFHRSNRELPERIDPRDLALLTVASHKAARMIAKDRVTSAVRAPFTRFQSDAGPGEVDEAARGRGLRRAIGELLVCPYCLGMWTSAALTAMLLVFPRFTRWFASVLAMFFGSEMLQFVHHRIEQASQG
ncbi:MAG TPA: DUF1360 domain-containing protein [Solirubrobacteraceae bacterium]